MKKLLSIILAIGMLLPGIAGAQVFKSNQVISNPTSTIGVIVNDGVGTSTLRASSTPTIAGLRITGLNGFLKATAGVISTALINLTTDVTGILPQVNGGTGTTSIANLVPYTGATSNVNIGNFVFLSGSTTATSSFRNTTGSTTVLTLGPIGQGTTNTQDSLTLQTATSATSTTSQNSPAIVWSANGWKSNAVTASQTVKFKAFVEAISASTNPQGLWHLLTSINGEVWRDIFRIDARGQATIDTQVGASATTTLELKNNFGDGSPGTTRTLRLTTKSGGSYGWIDWFFEGVSNPIKGAIGVSSNGEMLLNAATSFYYYIGSTFNNLIVQFFSGGIYNNGGIFNHGNVTAGSVNQSPSATLTTYGSLGAKTRLVTSSETLGSTDTNILVDASNAFACTGTPSNACGSYGSQGTCEANNSHNGCSWFAGYDCSVYNGNEGACTITSGCSAGYDSCSAYNGNSGACTGQTGCSYPGNLGNCSAFNGNMSTCGSTTGCSYPGNLGDCSGFNESTCAITSGCSVNYNNCSWDSGMGVCNGGGVCNTIFDEGTCNSTPDTSSFVNCTGSYDDGQCTGNYDDGTCSGSFFNGSCSGTYGAACSGTANCTGFATSTTCGAETGCSSTTGINITLPSDSTSPFYRDYWIKNVGATGTVSILANTGQYIEQASSTMNLTKKNAAVMFTFYKNTADCSIYNSNESTCGTTSGCSQNYQDCSSLSDESSCTTDSHCFWNGSSCDNGNHFHSCSGTYTSSKNWYIMSSYLVPN